MRWLSRRGFATPVTPFTVDVRPRRRRLRLPTFGGTWPTARRQRMARRVARGEGFPFEHVAAEDVDDSGDDINEFYFPVERVAARDMDESDDDILDIWWPNDFDERTAFFMHSAMMPIPEQIEGSAQNEVINMNKGCLLKMLPTGKPRQPQGGMTGGASFLRPASAPKLAWADPEDTIEHRDIVSVAYREIRRPITM